jgi:hypothetical protein
MSRHVELVKACHVLELISVPQRGPTINRHEETRAVVQLSVLLSIATLHARAGEYLGPN